MPIPNEAFHILIGIGVFLWLVGSYALDWLKRNNKKEMDAILLNHTEVLQHLIKINKLERDLHTKWQLSVIETLKIVDKDLTLQKNDEIMEEVRKIKEVFLVDGSTMHVIEAEE